MQRREWCTGEIMPLAPAFEQLMALVATGLPRPARGSAAVPPAPLRPRRPLRSAPRLREGRRHVRDGNRAAAIPVYGRHRGSPLYFAQSVITQTSWKAQHSNSRPKPYCVWSGFISAGFITQNMNLEVNAFFFFPLICPLDAHLSFGRCRVWSAGPHVNQGHRGIGTNAFQRRSDCALVVQLGGETRRFDCTLEGLSPFNCPRQACGWAKWRPRSCKKEFLREKKFKKDQKGWFVVILGRTDYRKISKVLKK